jgi:hypothetical protein
VTFPPSAARKMALDEESFQLLLAAAYALQENKDVLQASNSEQDAATVLSDVASLRSQIFAHVDAHESKALNSKDSQAKTPAEAAALVADCLRRLTKADGVSVCLIVDGYLRPTACSGIIAKVSGGSVASNSLVATERLRNGRPFQSANACSDIRLGPSLCVQLQIGSLLAFPIERQNEIAGIIEVRWTKAAAFSAGDERICQLMADLMGDALEGGDGGVNALSQAASHPVGQVSSANVTPITSRPGQQATAISSSIIRGDYAEPLANVCRVCGKSLTPDDNFCGNCGMLSTVTDHGLQSKWASMWFMQQAQKSIEADNDSVKMWPLHETKSDNASSSGPSSVESVNLDHDSEKAETDEAHEGFVAGKRSARSVLSVLKARLRVRAMGQ